MGKALSQQEVETRIRENYTQDILLISPYINKRSNITLRCNDCGYEWTMTAQSALYDSRVNGKKTCPNCGINKNHGRMGELLHCAACGKELYRSPQRIEINKTGYFYCSRECGNIHKNQLRDSAGEWQDSKNYRKKAFDFLPHVCCSCGWKEDERILEVHHIDGNRENNILENLCILCPICHRKITLKYYELTQDFQLIPV